MIFLSSIFIILVGFFIAYLGQSRFGEKDNRFRTGFRGNDEPEPIRGCLTAIVGLLLIAIGFGHLFLGAGLIAHLNNFLVWFE